MSASRSTSLARRVAVIGAGWAGLAAAVEAVRLGYTVHLFEMARQTGGRARSDAASPGQPDAERRDNGQHILIGAYQATLALMRQVGVDPEQVLMRRPLAVVYPDGQGLRLPPGPAVPAFLWGVWRWRALSVAERWGLLRWAARWRWRGFRCDPRLTVADISADCPPRVHEWLIDPLSVAALNTPSHQASAQVLLTVLRDALFGPRGSSDVLLPRAPLSALLPDAAQRWLQQHGATLTLGRRVQRLTPQASGAWCVDDEVFDHVIVASSAVEAARLLAPHAPIWAEQAAALHYEPIITVWLEAPGARWPEPMLALRADAAHPAQFGFDLGQLGGVAGQFSLVVSGASVWLDRPLAAVGAAVCDQLRQAWRQQPSAWPAARVRVLAIRAEKRATFACVPGLQRPCADPLPGVSVAGDHVAGPYPATLEAAVRSGVAAAQRVGRVKAAHG
ncbi:hydroxysqualene dehydroxylase HpnE [Vitreoscilla filiformis]|jgi:squalene-associated FAD-dependent desaturase|uniref:hydroxysqualene dehydroxylase HpnE n=1 Tax=Vitreoscilla filiformis TaxID=63 RepID=UPI000B79D305|nr:hydroxysqualene dehydroxylase HpnE [Vitreoscilla filiformis]